MWTYNGKLIREGRSWTDNKDVQHPPNWNIWSEEEKLLHGMIWVEPQEKPDERFYWFSQNVDGTYKSTPKNLDDLKTYWIANTKKIQGNILSETDWVYIRKLDKGREVPFNIQTYRNNVRRAAETIETNIRNCLTLDEFKTLFVSPVGEDGNIIGKEPINNWPDDI